MHGWRYLLYISTEFACLNFPLSDEPNFGTWRIQANLKVNRKHNAFLASVSPILVDNFMVGLKNATLWVTYCVNVQIPDEQGGCRVFYSIPTASCTFKVEEFGKQLQNYILWVCFKFLSICMHGWVTPLPQMNNIIQFCHGSKWHWRDQGSSLRKRILSLGG